MTAAPTAVRLAAEDEIADVGRLLGGALADDPLFVHLFPDPAERPRLAVADVTPVVRAVHQAGEVWVTDDLTAAACWRRPGEHAFTAQQAVASGLATLGDAIGAEAVERVVEVFDHVDARMEALGLPDHWYLAMAGVAPGRRRAGLGTAVLAPVLGRADAGGVPCYLETMEPSNVPFYESLGFRVAEAAQVPSCGLPYWLMVRGA